MQDPKSTTGEVPLTKSEFLAFLECEKDFWLQRRRPDAINRPPPSDFDKLLMEDGYAVEAVARAMFAARADAERFTYQTQLTDGHCFARADIIGMLPDGRVEIYEVKSSTSPKEHIADACFQRIVAERSGLEVAASYIVHVDSDYRRSGALDAEAFLVFAPVDEAIAQVRAEIEEGIEHALALLAEETIDETGCGCLLKSRARQCASFAYFNPNQPDPSVHVLPRMAGARLAKLVEEGRQSVHDATPDDVTAAQLPVLLAMQSGKPIIDRDAIRTFLAELTFPLHFYDYETAAGAIPMAEGHGPHEQIPVQFSCHVLAEDGSLSHAEFLAQNHGEEGALVEALRLTVEDAGSVLVWNETFERGCNRRMARLLPDDADFLEDVNIRTVDLMSPFRRHYVDPGFYGSTSIKKVLPVLCPSLSYDGMAVHDGTGAILAFREMVDCQETDRRDALRDQLIEYCRLDTLAMVEIYRRLVATCE